MPHKVLVGINYTVGGVEKRAEPGDLISDLPAEAVAWMTRDGVVEAVGAKATSKRKAV